MLISVYNSNILHWLMVIPYCVCVDLFIVFTWTYLVDCFFPVGFVGAYESTATDPNSRSETPCLSQSWTVSKRTTVRFDCSENAQGTETSLQLHLCVCVCVLGQHSTSYIHPIIQITDNIDSVRDNEQNACYLLSVWCEVWCDDNVMIIQYNNQTYNNCLTVMLLWLPWHLYSHWL